MSASFWFACRMAGSGAVLAIGGWAYLRLVQPEAKSSSATAGALTVLVGAATVFIAVLMALWTI